MAFTPPKTFAVGEILSAVDMNVFVRDNTEDLDARIIDITDGDFSFRYAGSRIYKATGTFDRNDAFGNGTDTSWLRYVRGRMVGGGGSGSPGDDNVSESVGGGGASGAYIEFFYPYSFLLDDGDVVIGDGGVGPASGSGGSGGNTTFELTFGVISAPGGFGGFSSFGGGSVGRGGFGVAPTGSSLSFVAFNPYRFANGQTGGPGNTSFRAAFANDDTSYITGNGSDSMLGQGGQGSTIADDQYRAGAGYGFGGGGGINANVAGQDGGDGVVMLDFFR